MQSADLPSATIDGLRCRRMKKNVVPIAQSHAVGVSVEVNQPSDKQNAGGGVRDLHRSGCRPPMATVQVLARGDWPAHGTQRSRSQMDILCAISCRVHSIGVAVVRQTDVETLNQLRWRW